MNAYNALPQTSPRFHWKALVLSLLAALAAAVLFSAPLQAQGGPEDGYVDLVMTHEYDAESVVYRVQNFGTATATGVTVSFHLKDLQASTFRSSVVAGTHVIPIITNKRDGDANDTNQTFTWEVGTIRPGDTAELVFTTRPHSGHTTWEMIGVITAAVSSDQPEPEFLSGNNKIKLYSFTPRTGGVTLHMSDNKLALQLSVSNLRPAEESAVNFGLTARNRNTPIGVFSAYINLIDDIKIKVELSDGLEFNWQPAAPADFDEAGSRQSGTWMPEGVDTIEPDPNNEYAFLISRSINIQTQLTSDSLTDIPLEERCITAWVEDSIPPPSPDYALGSLTQCLGDDPPVLINSGEIDLFTVYPCAGASTITYPCRDEDGIAGLDNGLELVATVDNYHPALHVVRPDDVVRLRPETFVIQVKDPRGTRR